MLVYVGPQQTASVTHFLFPVLPHAEGWVNLCLYDVLRLSCCLTRQLAPSSVLFPPKEFWKNLGLDSEQG